MIEPAATEKGTELRFGMASQSFQEQACIQREIVASEQALLWRALLQRTELHTPITCLRNAVVLADIILPAARDLEHAVGF